MTQTDTQLSKQIEDLLVRMNPRGMKDVQPALKEGYYERAANYLRNCKGTVLIGTGFPVVDTFETDGPVGAIALYQILKHLGADPVIVCGKPISQILAPDYKVHEIQVGEHDERELEALEALARFNPDVVLSIERPGQAKDGGYYNIRGESISPRTACYDTFVKAANCPTIGIGDGGNEIGMGNIYDAISNLNIVPSATRVDELVISDVSNWGAYGLIAMLGYWKGEDLLAMLNPQEILEYLSERGSLDGVTRLNELTEDGMPSSEGETIIAELRKLTGFA